MIKTAPKNNLQEGKPQPSLIPIDLLIKVLEPAYREGLLKYYRNSWREGFLTSTMFDATIRHLSAYFYDKEDYDQDAEKLGIKKLHLGGALFSILCMIDTLLNHPELEDRGKDYKEDVKSKEFTVMDLHTKLGIPIQDITEDMINQVKAKGNKITSKTAFRFEK